IDCAEDEQPRRRAEHLGKDTLAVALEQLRPRQLAVVGDPPLAGTLAFDDREDHLRSLGVRRLALDPFDEDVDLAAAREPDLPGVLVRDPVGEQLRLAALEDLARVNGYVALDAAAGHGACELAGFGDRQLRPERPGGRAPRRDDGRERNGLSAVAPALDCSECLAHPFSVPPLVSRPRLLARYVASPEDEVG